MHIKLVFIFVSLFLTPILFGQSLNRSNVTFVSGEDVVNSISVNGSAYSVANYFGQNVILSGFQQLDSLDITNDMIEIENGNISVYPNPFTSNFTVRTSINNFSAEIALYDMLGRKLYADSDFKGGIIDAGTLSAGTYYLMILDSSMERINIKLIKE